MLGQFNKTGVLCMLVSMPLFNLTHKIHKVTGEMTGDSRRKLHCMSLHLFLFIPVINKLFRTHTCICHILRIVKVSGKNCLTDFIMK